MTTPRPDRLFLFRPPYRKLDPIRHPGVIEVRHAIEASTVVWSVGSRFDEGLLRALRWREPGIPLIVIAPPAREMETDDDLLRVLELCRPQALVPWHQEPSPMDLRALLTEPPEDLAVALVDYLVWRGLVLDLEVRRLLRRTFQLSGELRTVAGLARGVYLSRRALGRRFMREGLPVPSHWLHFGRLLRAVLMLQEGSDNLVSVAFRLGYPDGFALSNQMKRLTGIRPSDVADRLGWDWFVEAWIREEVRCGGFGEIALEMMERRGAVLSALPDGPSHPVTPPPGAAADRAGDSEPGVGEVVQSA